MTLPDVGRVCPVCQQPAILYLERGFLAVMDRGGETVTARGTWHGDGAPPPDAGVTYTADPAADRASYSCPSLHSVPARDLVDPPALLCPVEGEAFNAPDVLAAHLLQHGLAPPAV